MFAWDQSPVGDWQQMGYLLAGLALERVLRSPRPDPSTSHFAADRDRAEARLRGAWSTGSVFTLARALAEAVLWRGISALAARMLPELTGYFRAEYGLHIDSAAMTITLDPDFRAEQHAIARRAFLDAVRALCLQQSLVPTLQATGMAWEQATRLSAELAAAAPEHRDVVLDAADLDAATRAEIVFLADYLADRLDGRDLTATPVLVDLAAEAREHIQTQISQTYFFAEPVPQDTLLVKWSTYDRDAALLTAQDRALLDAFAERPDDIVGQSELVIWPGIAERSELEQMLHEHAESVGKIWAYAVLETAYPHNPIDVDYHSHISDLFEAATRTIELVAEQARHGAGLLEVERQHTLLTIAATDLGTPPPRLAFVGELHKWRTDVPVANQRAGQLLASQFRGELADTLRAVHGVNLTLKGTGTNGPTLAMSQLHSVHASIQELARWDADPVRALAAHHDATRHLDRDLAFSGASFVTRADVRTLLDSYAERAGALADHARGRDAIWETRLQQVSLQQLSPARPDTTSSAINAALPQGPGTSTDTMPPPPTPGPPSPSPPGTQAGPQL